MNIQIDEKNKTVTLLEAINISTLYRFLEFNDMLDYDIVPNNYTIPVVPYYPQITYQPFEITCNQPVG